MLARMTDGEAVWEERVAHILAKKFRLGCRSTVSRKSLASQGVDVDDGRMGR